MGPFIILCVAPLFPLIKGKLCRGKCRPEDHKAAMVVFFSLLFLFLALRDITVGRDLANYRVMFRRFSGMAWNKMDTVNTEKGYVIINKIIALFTTDFQWVIVITAMICIIPLAVFYVSETEQSMMTIALFLTMSTFQLLFSGLRQSIAISVGLIAFKYVKKKKWLAFLIAIGVAMMFHRSAFILLAMYPVYHMKITKVKALLSIPFLGAIFIFKRQIFTFLTLFISDRYSTEVSSTGAYTMLILIGLFVFYTYFFVDETKMDHNMMGMRNLLLLSFALQMFASVHYLAMRMNYYYLIFIPLTVPKVFNRAQFKYNQIVIISKYVIVLFFICYFFYHAPQANSLDIFPYQFFWES